MKVSLAGSYKDRILDVDFLYLLKFNKRQFLLLARMHNVTGSIDFQFR